MAKKRYYAVKIGLNPGIYETWEECQLQTEGFSGSKFKAFDSKEEANSFLIEDENVVINSETGEIDEKVKDIDYDEMINDDLNDGYVVAFTDGSFDGTTKESSYGIVLITPEKNGSSDIIEESNKVLTSKFKVSNNITGEVFGVINACEWCFKNGFDKISIYCDYQGLYEWANGSWRAKTDIAKYYVEKINDLKVMLDIKFTWVKGHSDVQYNDQADILAKNALAGNRKFKSGANFFSGAVSSQDAVEKLLHRVKEVVNYERSEPESVNGGNGLKTALSYEKEKVHVTFYHKNRSILVQGKPGFLFSYLLSFYSEQLSVFDLVRTYSSAYESTIKKERVENEFKNLKIPSNYPHSLQQLIKQSISSLYIKDLGEYDYGHYTVPAYRSLEGHLRYLCEQAGFHLEEKINIGGNFNIDASTGDHFLTNNTLKNSTYKDEIEKCYNLYYKNRHPLLHTGEIGHIDTTLLIATLNEAKARIKEVLDLIQF